MDALAKRNYETFLPGGRGRHEGNDEKVCFIEEKTITDRQVLTYEYGFKKTPVPKEIKEQFLTPRWRK